MINNESVSESEILAIQNRLISGNYRFSPFDIESDSESNLLKPYDRKLGVSLNDELVLCVLGAILLQELDKSSYFRQSCYRG